MLVLTRKSGESIIVGDNIEIIIVQVDGDAVRVGVKAPREVPVYRREIYEAIRLENIKAAASPASLAQKLRSFGLLSSDQPPFDKD